MKDAKGEETKDGINRHERGRGAKGSERKGAEAGQRSGGIGGGLSCRGKERGIVLM